MPDYYCQECGEQFHQVTGRPGSLCGECRKTGPGRWGHEHRKARAEWAELVSAGGVLCHAVACRQASRLIVPPEPWDLGHDDQGNSRGPEHKLCNELAGLELGRALRYGQPPPQPKWSPTRNW